MPEISDFIIKLLDASDWPSLWHDGKWTPFHGWLYIISDLLIWSAYFTIPVIIIRYITTRKHQRIRLYFLFAAFIMACGTAHLLDAVNFWYPAYRLSAVVRAITAIISWVTIFNMIKVLPYYFSLRSPETLEAEVIMRKKAEKELYVKNEQLRNAEIIGQFGHFEWNTRTNGIKISEGMRRLFELNEKEEITTLEEYLRFFPDKEKEQQATLLSNFINASHFRSHYQKIVTARNKGKNFLTRGTLVTDTDGQVEKIIITSQDITEFKKNKQLLEESRRIFKNAFDFASIGMALVDIKGRWLDVNQSACDIFGYTKEEMQQRTFIEMTHPDDIQQDLEYIKKLLAREIDNYRMEKRYFKKDGGTVWVLLSVSLVWKNQQPAYFTAQLVDITSNKHLIAELEHKNNALGKANTDLQYHINHVTEFNRIISHNLRGPASSLISIVDFLQDCNHPEDKAEVLSEIKSTSELVIQTLNDLKDVIEIQLNKKIVFDRCNLQQTLDNSMQRMTVLLEQSRAIITTQFEVTDVHFPPSYLNSIFDNLISNALTYRKTCEKAQIRISATSASNNTVLVFEDNGLGIDMNRYKDEIFKYKRVFHKGYDSKGLGLFLIKSQIEACGGKISVQSDGATGTTFTIIL